MPVCLRMMRRSSRSLKRSFASRFDKGSSSNNSCGRYTMLRASATRCIWPPDSATTGRSAYSVGPPAASTSSTLRRGLGARDLAVLERIDHVLPHRHVRPHRVGLEHHAEVARPRRHQDAALGRRHQIPGDADLAAGRMLEPGDAAQGRGLAAAGGTEQHHDLAGRHREADAVDGRPADRKLLAQVGDVERRRHDVISLMNVTITGDIRTSCPIPPPMARAA